MVREYRVQNFDDDNVSPEETLIDSASSHDHLEIPVSLGVIRFFYFLLAGVLVIFFLASFKLQIINGASYRKLAQGNRSLVYDLPALRGDILDEEGRILAENEPSFDLAAISSDLPKNPDELNQIVVSLSKILKSDPAEILSIFKERQTRAVFFIRLNLTKEEVLQIQNQDQRGIYEINVPRRRYYQGEKFAGIVGYTGKISPEDLTADSYYNLNDRRGRSGIEAGYEQYLRGEHGQIFFDRAGHRYVTAGVQPGQSVVLNINRDIQEHLYSALAGVLKSRGVKSGAAVVQNVQTGAVLGLVSLPSFDNNNLTGEIKDDLYQKYFYSKDRPTFNRAIGGRYHPGSTIKPLLALAGLKEKVITPSTTITDLTGYITVKNIYNPEIVYTYRDWRVQGTVDLKKALAWSSDIYFYSVGGGHGAIKGLGFKLLEEYFRQFLIDRSLGLDIPGEVSGFVPDENWKLKTFGQPWFTGDTYNVSIGQGDLVTTPLWLSSFISAIANGGTFYQPRLAKKIVDLNQKEIKSFSPKVLTKLPFDRSTLDVVREGLREVVTSGTGQLLLNDLPVKVAAKTGTAEIIKGKSLNSILLAYAPYDDPQIALAVVVEDIGKSQGLALLAAHDFFNWYFRPAVPSATPSVSPAPSL